MTGRERARALRRSCAHELVPLVQAITAPAAADDCCLHQSFPENDAARVRARRDRAVRLRLRPRPAGQDPPPVHDQVLARRRAHHHARARGRPGARRCSARCTRPGTRMYEQGIDRDYEGTPLAERHLGRRAREPVAAVGEPGRAQPAVLEALLSRSCRPRSRPSSAKRAARHVLPRHQQGRALADPHRRRRGHLQPARHAALRPRARAARGQAGGRRPARGLARARSQPTSASRRPTTATAAAGRALVSTARSAARSRATRSATS